MMQAQEMQERPTPQRAAAAEAAEPLRRCIVTRNVAPRRTLLRLVVAPDGTLVPDIEATLPGRGMWITPRPAVIEEARRKSLFAKAAKRQVTVPADLAQRIEAGLARRCVELLGLARRAGQAAAGFEKVRGWLREGRAGLLVEASDGAPDGRRKIAELAAAIAGGADAMPPVATALSAAELAAALGRETAVHVAVSPGRLAMRLRDEAARLGAMRFGETSLGEMRAGAAAGDAVSGGTKKNERIGS